MHEGSISISIGIGIGLSFIFISFSFVRDWMGRAGGWGAATAPACLTVQDAGRMGWDGMGWMDGWMDGVNGKECFIIVRDQVVLPFLVVGWRRNPSREFHRGSYFMPMGYKVASFVSHDDGDTQTV